jgi:cadmium resistance protein CadD (predicted permease)
MGQSIGFAGIILASIVLSAGAAHMRAEWIGFPGLVA